MNPDRRRRHQARPRRSHRHPKDSGRTSFDRAEHHCEWCENRYDRLQIHHIEPRSAGGPNTKRNLIALCPTCYDKADHGGISKTRLEGKVRQIMSE